MFWGENPTFCLLSKKWKTPKYLQNGHTHRKSNLKGFRKDPPQLLLMYIFKTQNLKPSLYSWACFQPSIWDGKLFLPLKKQLKDRIRGVGALKSPLTHPPNFFNEIAQGLWMFPILTSALSDLTGYCMTHWCPESVFFFLYSSENLFLLY